MKNMNEAVKKQRLFFEKGITKGIDYRIQNLKTLKRAIIAHESDIIDALKKDLNKAPFEAYATEIGLVLEELEYIVKHLRNWAKPRKVKTPLTHFLSVSRQYSEPYGIVLIMSPWNYPFQLTIAPLIGAMAAGNCMIVKPSEYSSHTAEIIERLLSENFDESYITVVRGGREANKTLLDEKFDYIFFTGSVSVGRVVMESASKHLTPVSLELGGKSPCIVDETANLDMAAKRIVWGKYLNAGQTCVAPDYLLVHKKVKNELITKMSKYIEEFYGADPYNNSDYPKIINDKHFNRLLGLIQNETIAVGGKYNDQTRRIAPTILDHVTWDRPIMQEEIFGPLLPVIEFESLDDVIVTVNHHPKPLALYFFTQDRKRERYVIDNTSFGGGCINDTVVHLATSYMPFGGVGESGMGGYHGKASFDTFSHRKSILKKSTLLDIPLRYPPYKDKLKLLKRMMR